MSLPRNREENEESELKIDVGTIICFILGLFISWGNMLLILNSPSSIEVLAYLSIILTTMIPGIMIALKNRYWGYGYLIGFSLSGIPFMILMDLFIGGYTFVTTLFIFIILWLIFWKTWRSLGAIKREKV
ncbi:MAG: hypothetical protein EU516_00070 [Promethearchaeota archaeon]|jgi:hypothetical protein|nr:MAG: hypothetical protein EU516_00070 [Candidatus Lokiarchaeota archaeon]